MYFLNLGVKGLIKLSKLGVTCEYATFTFKANSSSQQKFRYLSLAVRGVLAIKRVRRLQVFIIECHHSRMVITPLSYIIRKYVIILLTSA